jgi:ABC-type transport system involved in multi-copper enzyme maturation permease subunit
VTPPPPAAPPPPATGTIHDLGSKRYVGTRRPQSTRWRVIARNQMAMAWKGFWRFKLPLFFAATNTIVWAALLTAGALTKIIQEITRQSPEDAYIALSYSGTGWYCNAAFIASMTVGAGVIASDIKSGAFTFYFARPVRPIDYVLGKLGGMFALFAMIFLVGPLILAGVRLGMYGSLGDVVANLDLLAKVALIGVLSSLAYAAIPLAFSALAPSRRYALALWVAYYWVIGTIVSAIGLRTSPIMASLDIPTAIRSLAFDLLDVELMRSRDGIEWQYAVFGLSIQIVIAVAIVFYRVREAEESGVGGSG